MSGGALPLDPVGPPVLIPERESKRAGHFFVNLFSAAPRSIVNESIDRAAMGAVAFLFRFEEINSSIVFYNWTVSYCRDSSQDALILHLKVWIMIMCMSLCILRDCL